MDGEMRFLLDEDPPLNTSTPSSTHSLGMRTILSLSLPGFCMTFSLLETNSWIVVPSALKITTARYYTPNGVCIHGEGIEPDDVVELDEGLATKAVISKDEDNQFQEGLRILKEKMD